MQEKRQFEEKKSQFGISISQLQRQTIFEEVLKYYCPEFSKI